MEKTFGQIEETNNEVASSLPQANQDETSAAVASLTTILEESTLPNVRVISYLHGYVFLFTCLKL